MSQPHVTPQERKAQVRYDLARGIGGAVLVTLMLALLGGILLIGLSVREQNRTALGNQRALQELGEQNRADSLLIADLLERQRQNDLNRQQVIDAAVAAIAKEQRESLAAHDGSVKDFLAKTLNLVDQEVNAPASQEDAPVVVVPGAIPRPAPAVPRPLPPALARKLPIPPPAPAPAPAPPPCDPLGKSGKCKPN